MLAKISYKECTIPVGENCLFASLRDAEAVFAASEYPKGHVSLCIIQTQTGEKMYAWALMEDEHTMLEYLPVFDEQKTLQGIPQSMHVFEKGEYFFYNDRYYYVVEDDAEKLQIRRMNRFFRQQDMEAVFHIGFNRENDAIQWPIFSLAKITSVQAPHKTLSAAWIFIHNNTLNIAPVFEEDTELLQSINLNELNWQFMNDGDRFLRGGHLYQVCFDEAQKWYIAASLFQM